MDVEQFEVNLLCQLEVALEGGADHGGKAVGEEVGDNGDNAAAPTSDEREGEGIVAGKDGEVFGAVLDDFGSLDEVARSFFDRHEFFAGFSQAEGRFGVHVGAGPARYVIDDHRYGGGFRNSHIVLKDALLRRFAVGGATGHEGVKTVEVVVFDAVSQFFGVIMSKKAGDEGNATICFLDGKIKDLAAFFGAERDGFAGRAEGDDIVDAPFDHKVDHFFEGGVVDVVIFERRH